jgi:hypothetical protein
MAKKKEILLGIDPQIDFCQPTGSLYVPGADKDMERLGVFIKKKGRSLSQIGMTLDSHHVIDVGHPAMWVDSRGNYPAPFTIITNADLQNGVYRCRFPNLQTWFLDYTAQLIAHRGVNVGIAAGYLVAGIHRQLGDTAHEGAADAQNMNVHVT